MLLSTQYFPSLTWMQTFLRQQDVQIEQWENYQKQGLMNRCKILGAEGVLTLSVPLIGGREQKTVVKDIAINNSSRWNIDQLRGIKSCYSKSPFFDYYYEYVENILTKNHHFLLDLNMEIMDKITSWLHWKGDILLTPNFEKNTQSFTYKNSQPKTLHNYIQVFADRQPFTPNLSILDLLFCTGPQAKNYLLP